VLQDRVFDLQQLLLQMERQQTDLESRIREEVATEMAQQLVEVEESYQAMMAQTAQNIEQT
jgi:hypothetical protein